MEPPQCVEELEDDVFQPEDGEPGTQPGSLLSADLFAQSQLDCPLSRLQLFPLTHCCGPGLRPTSQEDKATQTLSPASPSQGVMLPCGVTEEPQRLFYGNAGYRLPLPAGFPAGLPLGEQPAEGQWQHRAEVQIARKLQRIANKTNWGGRFSLSLPGNRGLGLWSVCTSESLSRPAAGRSAGRSAGSLAPAPPGRSIACQWSMRQSPSTKAAAGGLVLEEPYVPWAGGCPAPQPLSGPPPGT
ncbi:bcl-2-modifying factor [Neophocaena asiaeorientalis asiaeorientalis]|uniref:Bcl-2-modifying factor n=1 Tax=Neophocaena asiaeorientalis asiaeorientalis TaxID=1706337 RepID=A0A341AGW3_NEOAA|nr:bcl-2-modifying factor [Neophocaena asiaeorientalis asiaeorientalis]